MNLCTENQYQELVVPGLALDQPSTVVSTNALNSTPRTPYLPLTYRLWLDWKAEGSDGSSCLPGDFRISGDPEHGFDFEFLDLETGDYRACLHSAELAMCFTAFLCDRFAQQS